MLAISIIISLFNAQIYIRCFAASLQAQTFQNFEIIFTNDLPPDQSAEILREFTTSNPRIKVITRPHNMGTGAARNTEIHAPTGETLCFAAPDDLLPPTSIEIRYTPSKKHKAIVRACHDEIGSNDTIPTHETRPGACPTSVGQAI